jgi:hypothetical protein
MLEKQKGKNAKKATADCSCTIYAEGTLVKGGFKTYVRPKSTDKREWSEAETVKTNWLEWGATKPAKLKPEPEAADALVTVQSSVTSFLLVKKNQETQHKILPMRYQRVEQFLKGRLIPFATPRAFSTFRRWKTKRFGQNFSNPGRILANQVNHSVQVQLASSFRICESSCVIVFDVTGSRTTTHP